MNTDQTLKEQPIGSANNSAGHTDARLLTDQVESGNEGFATLPAQFAMRGQSAHPTNPCDGAVSDYAERWGQSGATGPTSQQLQPSSLRSEAAVICAVPLPPDQPEETAETPVTTLSGVTNAEFLSAIFVELQPDERPMIVSIAGVINARTKWPPGLAWTPETCTSDSERNWYFTLSGYLPKNGEYRRKKDQFHRAHGVYLDDIGTKAAPRERLEACPPSYLVETSEGNYQAGYLFDRPIEDLAQVEALQEALVKAGLCDPGAKGPSARLGRLPCGINGKYSPEQPCRLVEWHPERRYSIEQIVDLLELEPVQQVGRRRRTRSNAGRQAHASSTNAENDIYLPRAAENAVLVELRQRGLYKQPLGDGKHDITCPWVHEHTGGIDHGTAYFEPNDLFPLGGFKCQHSHGDTTRISALLADLGVTFTEAKHKPTIRVAPGELHRVVDAAEHELAASRRHYQRGGLIVNVVTDPGTGETVIKPLNANGLMRSLSASATWERFDRRTCDFVVIDPPIRHVAVLYDSASYRHLPVLQGIARQPYLRLDGSLMTAAGFDPASGMFGVFDERAFLVPDQPTREGALQALSELQALLTEFGFAQPHDLAAAIAMMLTAAIRPALPVAPMAHIRAPQVSSGKSYLCGLIAAFAGPTRPAAYAFPGNEEECAKLLLSALLEAPAVVMFDNLTGDLVPFKSLCSALTEEFLTGRILGVSKTATVGTRSLFLSSGNNVDPVRDMTRRAVTITLDPACETPAARRFRSDPVAIVLADRARYVSLALTIVRAYLTAGSPPQTELQPLGSYGVWTRLVRSPLTWLGLPDPATAIYTGMATDPDRETLGRLLAACETAFGNRPTTVRDIVERVEASGNVGGSAELTEIVREIAEERGVINRKRFGRWIARHQGRIVAGLKFERDTRSGGSERWKVVVMGVSRVSVGQCAESVSVTAQTEDAEVF